ncbi:MAG: hypothetical protein SV760_00785 [Halobacteria archaeon]|nr:hypothetical protein [Halobacteria archaeon]
MTRDGKPVGSTGGGRHAPLMQPDDRPPADSHFCDAVGARVYCSKIDCSWCGGEDDVEGGNDDG